MKRIWLFFLLGAFLAGCTFKVKEYPVIKDPNYPKVVVKEKEGKVVQEKKPKEERIQVGTFYPDPTRGYIQNQTYNIFIKVWLDPVFKKGRAKGPPDFYLPPKAIVEAVMPLGNHSVYAEGMMQTGEYGWKSVGVTGKEVSIDHRVYYDGHYGWYVVFHQSDFRR